MHKRGWRAARTAGNTNIVEIAARSGDALLDSIDYIPWYIQTILNIHVSPR